MNTTRYTVCEGKSLRCLKNSFPVFSALAGLLTFLSLSSPCCGQSRDRSNLQRFSVKIPSSATIRAHQNPSALEHINAAESPVFKKQAWTISGNHPNGISVTFSAQSPFVHESDSSDQRDLSISVSAEPQAGSATWTTYARDHEGQAADATDFLSGVKAAKVELHSNGIGSAKVGIEVTFLNPDETKISRGNYYSEIVGTITAR